MSVFFSISLYLLPTKGFRGKHCGFIMCQNMARIANQRNYKHGQLAESWLLPRKQQ